jgi:hypothetical protein
VPHLLTKPGLILVVAWIAQTLGQLVGLSIITVGPNIAAASNKRAEDTYQTPPRSFPGCSKSTSTHRPGRTS